MNPKYKILVCRGPSCGDCGEGKEIAAALSSEIQRHSLEDRVELGWQSCFGRCRSGPNLLVRVERGERSSGVGLATLRRDGGRATMYNFVSVADTMDIVQEHLVGGRPVARLVEAAKK